MLGWYLAEGWISSRGARLNFRSVRMTTDTCEALIAAIVTVVGRRPVLAARRPDIPNARHLYVHAPVLARVVKAMGMGARAARKRLPDLLLNCDENGQLSHFSKDSSWEMGPRTVPGGS